ncbi:MAG: TMEM175 family protein [Deltaproteobacteria bacterium]
MEPLPRYFPLERVIAFNDGVFAVVITILVLGIEVPSDLALDPSAIALAREKLLHQLLVYVVAFGLIAMYWTHHSFLFAGLRRADRRLVVLNLLFLLPVTLLPFVTQLMGARRDDWRTVLVFAGTNLVAAWLVERQWAHVLTLPETHKGPRTARLARRLVWASRFFALVLFSGVLISLLDVKAGIAVILVMPVLFFINFVRIGKRPPSDDASADDTDPEAPP